MSKILLFKNDQNQLSLDLPIVRCIDDTHHDDLEVLVGRILANRVGAKDTESLDTTTDSLSLLSDGLKAPNGIQWSHGTESLGLTVTKAFGVRPFTASATLGNAVGDKALLVLVA